MFLLTNVVTHRKRMKDCGAGGRSFSPGLPPPLLAEDEGLCLASAVSTVVTGRRDRYRIVAVKAGQTVSVRMFDSAQQPLNAQVVQGIEIEDVCEILFWMVGGYKFLR